MIDAYLDQLSAAGKSDQTIRTYRTQLSKFFVWMRENGYPDEPTGITTSDVSEYRNHLQDLGKKPGTVNTALSSIEAFCKWMVEEGHMAANPAGRVKRVDQVPEPVKWLNKRQRRELIRTAESEKDLRNTCIILTLLMAGLRADELVNLKHDDILISERKGAIVVRKGKGNKRRVVPIEKDLRHWLAKYMLEDHISGEWLFDSQRGSQLSYDGVYQVCKTLGKKAYIENLTPHVLRHTYCHDLYTRGVDLGTIAVLAGHAKVDTTLIYAKPGEDDLQTAVDKLSYT